MFIFVSIHGSVEVAEVSQDWSELHSDYHVFYCPACIYK